MCVCVCWPVQGTAVQFNIMDEDQESNFKIIFSGVATVACATDIRFVMYSICAKVVLRRIIKPLCDHFNSRRSYQKSQ